MFSGVGPLQNQFGFAASFPKGASVSRAQQEAALPVLVEGLHFKH
jgi:hypothetical protein